MVRFRQLFLAIFVTACCAILFSKPAGGAGLEAEWVFYNGKILTADNDDPAQFSTAQAVAIYDGKFVVVGSNQEALATAGSSTKRIDLQGRTVLPGLIETHLHVHNMARSHHMSPLGLGLTDPPIDWSSKDGILSMLKRYAARKKPGEWIIATAYSLPDGAMNVRWASTNPSLAELDAAVPNNPVLAGGGNSGYRPFLVNTKTLDTLYARYPQGVPGILKDANGKPTGILDLTAAMVMMELTPPPTYRQIVNAMPAFRAELEEAAARGLTTVQTRVDWDALRVYMFLDQRAQMPIRLVYAPEMAAYSPLSDLLFRRVYIASGHGSPWLWMSGATTGTVEYGGSPNTVGSCINGAYKSESKQFPAWAHNPWGQHGECRFRSDSVGDDEVKILKDFFRNAVKNSWFTSNIHVNGDRTMDDYLDVLEEAVQKYGIDPTKFRFSSDHCGWVSESQAERAKRLGVSFTCQPTSFEHVEGSALAAYAAIYDSERAADAHVPMRRLVSLGMKPAAHCEGHQDWEFNCIKMMVERKDEATGRVWGPQQRIDRRQALYTFTRWAAWHAWKEKYIGSIEVGKWADLVVIDKDFLTIPEDEISTINPLLTLTGGKISYSQPQYASAVGLPTVGFQAPPDWWKR